MDDRTPGYDEPDRDELIRPLSLSEWDYLFRSDSSRGGSRPWLSVR